MRDQISNTNRYLLAVESPRTSDELFDVKLDLAAHIGTERWVYIHAQPFGTNSNVDPLGIAHDSREFSEHSMSPVSPETAKDLAANRDR